MMRMLEKVFWYWERISNAPETVRRRWARVFFLASLPIVVLAWWLSLRYSLVERTTADTVRSAASGGKAAAADVVRGFEQLRETFRMIRSAAEELSREEFALPPSSGESETSTPEQFSLPIVD